VTNRGILERPQSSSSGQGRVSVVMVSSRNRVTIHEMGSPASAAGRSGRPGPVFASLSTAPVPVIIVPVRMQRHFIKGLTAGAIKG
jgi:ABC-type glycerol-3-phosphate transport system permease component